MDTMQEAKVIFSQTASWNPSLRNPYRTRWAMVDGRYFKARSDRMRDLWIVDEVDADGEYIAPVAISFRLSDARDAIRRHVEGRQVTPAGAVEAVKHSPFTDDGVTYCGWDGHEGCGEEWPCSTVRNHK